MTIDLMGLAIIAGLAVGSVLVWRLGEDLGWDGSATWYGACCALYVLLAVLGAAR